jgi:hypothetical protein
MEPLESAKEEPLMARSLSLVVAIGIIAGSGVLHGLLTDRWALSDEPEASAAKLAGVARVLGDWDAKDLELDPKDLGRGGIVGYLARNYVNRRTGIQIQVILLCGRPGHISVHTPEACFAGAGFEMAGLATRYPFSDKDSPDFCWCAQFAKERTESANALRVFWAWNADGRWQAPANPRLTFARYRALFKLYLIHYVTDMKEHADKDPSRDLMKLLLPELQRCLFAED